MLKVFVIIVLLGSVAFGDNSFENVSFDLEILEPPRIVSRIVNGKAAGVNQFPHQALIFINTLQGTYQCGGSLIR
jgi:hypothetical protein